MRLRVGIRWWLAAAFALVSAATAVAAAEVLSNRSEAAFRDRAQALAAGHALQAAIELRPVELEVLPHATRRIADRLEISLFVFDEDGRLVTSTASRAVPLDGIPGRQEALETALAGERFVRTDESIHATIISFRLAGEGRAILLAYASHPDLAAGVGIVREEVVRAVWFAILLGAVVGLVIAALIARRLRRIAAAAAAIERGDFERPLRSDFADEVGALAATIDAMRLRLRESFRQVETERDRFRLLLERLQEGVVAVDDELVVRFANSDARELLRVREGEQLSDAWEGTLRAFAESLFDTAEQVLELDVAPDEEHVFSITGVAPQRPDDTAILIIADLSERERRERAEREFVANASHELRTPLTTILGAVEILQGGGKENRDDLDRFLAHIHREAARLVRLTRALLVLARAQTRAEEPRLSAVELRSLLEDVRETTTTRPGVTLGLDCPDGLSVIADRDLLEQAMANLAANAAEHTTEGEITIAARRENGHVLVDVADTGSGIAPALRDRVFDRFYRVDGRGDGFGLGLAIVRETVRTLGGTVSLVPEDKGTRVRVVLRAGEEAE